MYVFFQLNLNTKQKVQKCFAEDSAGYDLGQFVYNRNLIWHTDRDGNLIFHLNGRQTQKELQSYKHTHEALQLHLYF